MSLCPHDNIPSHCATCSADRSPDKWEGSAEYQLAQRILKAWEASPVDDNGFGETVVLARAYMAMVEASRSHVGQNADELIRELREWSQQHLAMTAIEIIEEAQALMSKAANALASTPSTIASREKAALAAWNALSEQLEREFGLSSVEVANIQAMADAIDALNAPNTQRKFDRNEFLKECGKRQSDDCRHEMRKSIARCGGCVIDEAEARLSAASATRESGK